MARAYWPRVTRPLARQRTLKTHFRRRFSFFCVRARIRTGQALGGWLYGVAHRLSLQTRSRSARRSRLDAKTVVAKNEEAPDLSWIEACSILHEELDRLPDTFRLPLLLCYLEGKSRDEAAELIGCTPTALHGRLERGRDRLRSRLTKRGVTLSVGLLGAVANSVVASHPTEAIIQAILTTATTGRMSSTVASLVHGATISMIYSKLKLAAVTFLVVALVTGGIGAKMSAAIQPPTQPKPSKKPLPDQEKGEETKEIAKEDIGVVGRVVGPDGKPVKDATLVIPDKNASRGVNAIELTKTDDQGNFHCTVKAGTPGEPDLRSLVARAPGYAADWIAVNEIAGKPVTLHLVADDVTVRGRVTDLQGKPIAEATILVQGLQTTPTGSLDDVFKYWQTDARPGLTYARKQLYTPTCAGLPAKVIADKQGNFEIKGAGRGRLVSLRFEAPGIESASVRVATLPKLDPMSAARKGTTRVMAIRPVPDLYGPEFTHAAKPDAVISGRVTDAKTGKPLAKVQVTGSADQSWWENNSSTMTDADGRYRLTGVAKANVRKLTVWPGNNSPYLSSGVFVKDAAGLGETTVNITLTRGVLVKGRIIDQATGEPIMGAGVRYFPLAENKFYDKTPGSDIFRMGSASYSTKADGSFQLVALPGVGLITAQGDTRSSRFRITYTQVRLDPADRLHAYRVGGPGLGDSFLSADGHIESLIGQSAYKIIDPAEGDETLKVELKFDSGNAASGTVFDADGKPAEGVMAYGLTAIYDSPTKLKKGAFTAIALDPKHPRTIAFVDQDRKLAGAAQINGPEKEAAVVKLKPWAAATGQIVDSDKKPIAEVEVSLVVLVDDANAHYLSAVYDIKATTDAEGKFRIDVPFGDVPFDLTFMRKGAYLQAEKARINRIVAPGKTIDVGKLELTPLE